MNNDLISRSALVDEFRARKMTDAVPNYDRATVDVKDALCQYAQLTKELLFAAPAVDAEAVRHGRWGRFGKTRHRIVCSACKFPTPFKKQANGYHLAWKSNYCPNCGVKMEQEDN